MRQTSEAPAVAAVLDTVAEFGRRAAEWHEAMPEPAVDPTLTGTIDALHLVNFSLWHCEDRARAAGMADADVVACKRAVDALNARRNKVMERVDELLVAMLPAAGAGAEAPLVAEQFETPGMLIDRLSIMALRIFHTSHTPGMGPRLAVLETQQRDLAAVLEQLVHDLFAGRRSLRVYRQFKIATSAPWDCGVWHDAHEWAATALAASE